MDEETRESLCCAATKYLHFLRNPKQLSCGHSVCETCVSNEVIICNIKGCGKANETDLKSISVSKSFKPLFNIFYNSMFAEVKEKFLVNFNDLKSNNNINDYEA